MRLRWPLCLPQLPVHRHTPRPGPAAPENPVLPSTVLLAAPLPTETRLPLYLNTLYFSCTRRDGTVRNTASHSEGLGPHNSTGHQPGVGSGQNSGDMGDATPGPVAGPGAPSGSAPDMAQEADSRAHGPEEGRRRLLGPTGQRRWSHASEARVQDAGAPPALSPALTPPEPPRRRQPRAHGRPRRPHLGLWPRKQDGGSAQSLAEAQAGLQRPEGPAPHEQPWPGQGHRQGRPQTWAP